MNSRIGDTSEALARYRDQRDKNLSVQADLKARDRQFGVARVGLFFASIAFWLLGYFSEAVPWATWIGFILLFVFLVVVVINEPLRDRLDELSRQLGVLKRLIARLERDWDKLATKSLTETLAAIELPAHQRDVADDLDLLGRASLFHLISMAATVPGIKTLASWLTQPADASVAIDRNQAIATLAPMRDERLRFYTLARQVGESSGDPQRFVAWAGDEPWLPSRSWLTSWANLSAVIAVISLLAVIGIVVGVVPATLLKTAGAALATLVAINLLLTAAVLGPAHQIFSIAMSSRQAVSRYQELFASAQWLGETGREQRETGLDADERRDCLRRIRHDILGHDGCARAGMKALQRVATAGGLRQSAGTFLLYLPLQAFGLWDVRVLKRLESWQAEYGAEVPKWFDALGELESLMSLAALRDEYPQWVDPTWIDDAGPLTNRAIVSGKSIGHPLLPDEARVSNDVSVGPPGTLLLVTGSNMSGKSTMLRSIGLNISLAGTGGPVCADSFELPSIELGTSIRVSDNLSEGVSFYMAELHRLKSVVDQARRLAKDEGRVLLFLLDEILQGTNSRERQIAVVQVLRHLMDSGAIGAISTHDLELADEPELMSISTLVHFRETIVPAADGNDQMTFDYKMRRGVSPTTNALKLLEIVGLGEAKP